VKRKLLSRFFTLSSMALLLSGPALGEVQFQPAEVYSAGSKAEAVAVADLNNDGRDDVVLSTSSNFDPENDFKLKLFLQDRYGTLQRADDYSLNGDDASLPKSIAIGDLNGDGLNDIAVGFDRDRIDIFSQVSDGTLVLSKSLSSPYSSQIVVADVTGDRIDDIVGVGEGVFGIAVYAMTNDPAYHHKSYIYYMEPDGTSNLVLGDINNDGIEDIVTVAKQSESNALAVMLSEGEGAFSPISYYELDDGYSVNDISIEDLNGDGRNDVWLSSAGENTDISQMAFYQGDDGVLEKSIFSPGGSIYGMLIAYDLNNDLNKELIAVPLSGDTVSIFSALNNGELLRQSSYRIPEDYYENPQGIDIGDINSDGIPDLVIASPSSGLVLLKGNTQGINLAPIADAGGDQVVRKGQLILLDGSHSADRDGSIIDYRWSQVSGSAVTLNETSNGFATFQAPSSKNAEFGGDEALVFELEVEDHGNIVSIDTAIVTLDGNIPPRAITTDFQVVDSGDVVTLDGSLSTDLLGKIVSYEWRQISGEPVDLIQESAATVSFTAPSVVSSSPLIYFEILKFELVVTDNEGLESSAVTQVNVRSLAPPVAFAGFSKTVSSGEEVLLDGRRSSDPDGEIVSYNWRSLSDISVINYPNGTASFIAPTVSPGLKVALLFELEVEDNDGLKSTGIVSVVVEQNMPPVMPISLVRSVQPSSIVTLDASGAFDVDGEIVSYQWEKVSGPSVSIINSDSVTATFTTPSEQTTLVFAVTLTDDDGESSTFNVSIKVF